MAKDKIHEIVKRVIQNDGWIVTDDPLILLIEDNSIAIDLAAEKMLIAEKGSEKIAIEI
jgi:XisH protein